MASKTLVWIGASKKYEDCHRLSSLSRIVEGGRMRGQSSSVFPFTPCPLLVGLNKLVETRRVLWWFAEKQGKGSLAGPVEGSVPRSVTLLEPRLGGEGGGATTVTGRQVHDAVNAKAVNLIHNASKRVVRRDNQSKTVFRTATTTAAT